MRIDAVVHSPGCLAQDLRLESLELDPPGPGEVCIRVAYAGVNRPDILQRQGTYPPPNDASPRLGLEVSGEVIALGSGVPADALGQRVCALTPGGGYASAVNTPWGHCMPIPHGLSMAEAAALPEALLTLWCHGVQRGRLSPSDRCLVMGGASGLGHWLLQLLVAWGNPVRDATAQAEEKRAFCRSLGATAVLPHSGPWERGRYDFIWDIAGGAGLEDRLMALAPEGRLVLVGLMDGAQSTLPLPRLLSHRLTVLGATLRGLPSVDKAEACKALVAEVWPLLTERRVVAHLHTTLPLHAAGDAHGLLDRGEQLGKVLLCAAAAPE